MGLIIASSARHPTLADRWRKYEAQRRRYENALSERPNQWVPMRIV